MWMRSTVIEMILSDTNLLHGVNDAGELFITQRFEGSSSEKGAGQISWEKKKNSKITL